MEKKITDIWPNLYRLRQTNSSQSADNNIESDALDQQPDVNRTCTNRILQGDDIISASQYAQVLGGEYDDLGDQAIQEIKEDFKHLYWSRFIVVDHFEQGADRKFALAPDIIEELEVLKDHGLNEDNVEWQPYFDPDEFTKKNQPLSIERFKLSNEELREWAV